LCVETELAELGKEVGVTAGEVALVNEGGGVGAGCREDEHGGSAADLLRVHGTACGKPASCNGEVRAGLLHPDAELAELAAAGITLVVECFCDDGSSFDL